MQNIKQFTKIPKLNILCNMSRNTVMKNVPKNTIKNTSPTKYFDICRAALKRLKVCRRLSLGSICAAQCT